MKCRSLNLETLIYVILILELPGCANSVRSRYTGIERAFVPEPTVRRADPVKTIMIASVPTGCIVELNGEYIGQTPFSLTVDSDGNGCWQKFYPDGKRRASVNKFTCTAPNGATDRRAWFAEDRIPDTVLFRPYGRYPPVQQLKLGMSNGS
jgi:hypothetical protein